MSNQENPDRLVEMYNPNAPQDASGQQPRAQVTIQAFNEVWEGQGWKLVEQDTGTTPEENDPNYEEQ